MRITHIASVAVLIMICSGWSIALSQPSSGDAGTVKKPVRVAAGSVRTVYKTTVKMITPSTGSLAVSADANSNLLVEPLNNPRAEGQEGTVPKGEHIFIFNDLKPGLYRIAGTLDKHHPNETVVEIKANKNQSVSLAFAAISYSLTINTNVATGDVRYAPEGEPLRCGAALVNGKVLLNLPVGKYTVAVSTSEFGYESKSQTILADKDQAVQIDLNRIVLSTLTLSPSWTKADLEGWELPAGWQDEKKTLVVKGPGVALPSQRGFRFYKDFRLTSTVKMSNRVAVSFALRAQDARNYYLVQVTGANSDDPHMLRLFLINDGVARRIMGIPIPKSAAEPMDAGQFFTISIRMIGYDITVQIIDTETGAPYSLGVLTDPEHKLAVGAVGIAARSNEESIIGPFVVCTGEKCFIE
jgi:hypothetical protein